MIYVRITEGLGNQFYKYAFAYSLAKKYNEKLIIDIAGFNFDPRSFVLDQFCIEANVVCLASPKKNNLIYKSLARIKRRFQIGLNYQYIMEDPSSYYQYKPIVKTADKTTYIQGYWQNYKYFENYKSEIREQFRLKNRSEQLTAYCKEAGSQESVAVHVRMGDYRVQDRLSLQYYYEALDYIQKIKNIKVYIFCEKGDLINIKDKFSPYAPIYIAEKYADLNDIESFELMRSCKNLIISNSTYSWWAAWLNENEQKTIIAPLIDKLDSEYYPEGWVLLNAQHEQHIA